MSEEQQELKRIDWAQVFSATQIFKGFKMAVHPSKMALCLVAIIVVFLAGQVMDFFWSSVGGQYVQEGEIYRYYTASPSQFDRSRDAWLDSRLPDARALYASAQNEKHDLRGYTAMLNAAPSRLLKTAFAEELRSRNSQVEFKPETATDLARYDDWSDLLSKTRQALGEEMDRVDSILAAARESAQKSAMDEISKLPEGDRSARESELAEQMDQTVALARKAKADRRSEVVAAIDGIKGAPIFRSLLAYELDCAANALMAARHANIFGGVSEFSRTTGAAPAARAIPAAANGSGPGFFYFVLLFVLAIRWLFAVHVVYAFILLAATLATVAFFGGAVHRIAALHFAREEKISATEALRFSARKFGSFFTAPLIPLAVLFGTGLVFLTIGGVIGSIPWFGDILMGLLFVLALAVGLLLAFLLVGLAAGGPLMYPTIAVEGSDGFDAISRSFSYVFARPWRAALYGLVALGYGVITYLFVRLFVFVAMTLTHKFVGWGVFTGGGGLGSGADKLDAMWPAPSFGYLLPSPQWQAMGGVTSVGAFFLSVWVFLLAATVLAYLLSYAASSTTIIYCLLRRKVDATDLDDVYVEESPEEEFAPEAEPGTSGPDVPPAQQKADEPERKPEGPQPEGDGLRQ
jgi:hypothetical protein